MPGEVLLQLRKALEPAADALEPLVRVRSHRMCIRALEELLEPCRDRDEPRLGDHQLAGQIHQVVEPVAVDADRFGDLRFSARGLWPAAAAAARVDVARFRHAATRRCRHQRPLDRRRRELVRIVRQLGAGSATPASWPPDAARARHHRLDRPLRSARRESRRHLRRRPGCAARPRRPRWSGKP